MKLYIGSNKKSAMFGLDARIALAIFGALSVITGAALYTAIGNAKATALLTEMQEVGKAWESYYLDTGTNLPQLDDTDNTVKEFYTLHANNLVENSGVTGWNGPYLNYAPNNYALSHPQYIDFHISMRATEIEWTVWDEAFCSTGRKCAIWSNIWGVPNDSLAKTIDKQVDGGDGALKGKFRWTGPFSEKYSYFLQIVPIKNPND